MAPFDTLLFSSTKNKMSQTALRSLLKIFLKNFKAELCVPFQSNWKHEDTDLLHQSQLNSSVHEELGEMNTEPLSAITLAKCN